MKNILRFFLLLLIILLTSCSSSPNEKAEYSVKEYLKANLKNAGSYESISFSKLDTTSKNPEADIKKIKEDTSISDEDKKEMLKRIDETPYSIRHQYSIINSDKDKVKMSLYFRLDKDFKVVEKSVTKSINGECGSLTGIATWKYNDYVGNKPDIGSEVILYSRDTIRDGLKYKTSVDAQGNYKIEKILPGSYLLIVQSKNATACPDKHLRNLLQYSDEIKVIFDFDINKYKTQIDEIHNIDSIAGSIIMDSTGKYGGAGEHLEKYYAKQKEARDKAEKFLNSLPKSFTNKIGLYTAYSYALDFSLIWIEEDKTENNNTDFGITCI